MHATKPGSQPRQVKSNIFDRTTKPINDRKLTESHLLLIFSLIFWASTYIIFSIRSGFMDLSGSDVLSFKRFFATLVGTLLLLVTAIGVRRTSVRGGGHYLVVILATIAASSALLLFRLAYEDLTEPHLSGLTGHGGWMVVWAGYFLAGLAFISAERKTATKGPPPEVAAEGGLVANSTLQFKGSVANPSEMTEAEIRTGLAKLAPFHHAIELPFGLNTYDGSARQKDRNSRGRIDSFTIHVWPKLLEHLGGTFKGKRVIDVACNCGGFSILAAEAEADEVVGFDSEEHYIEQAKFIRDARGCKNIKFEVDRLEHVNADRYGYFDVAFFCGIFYHLEDPIGGLRRVASLTTDTIVVDTHLMKIPFVDQFLNTPLWGMKIVRPIEGADTTTGLWRKDQHCQFTPTRKAVEDAMRFAGFSQIHYLEANSKDLEDRYYKRTRGVFIGRRG